MGRFVLQTVNKFKQMYTSYPNTVDVLRGKTIVPSACKLSGSLTAVHVARVYSYIVLYVSANPDEQLQLNRIHDCVKDFRRWIS